MSLSGLEPGLDPSRSPPIRAVWRVSVGLFISLYGGLPGWMVGEMNEPGMRSPAGYRARPRACLVSCLLVSGFSGPERRLFAAWRPGVIPGAYMPLQRLRFRRTDSQMPPAPAQATRGDPASCNAYQVAGECDGIIRRPGAWDNPPGATLVPPVPLSAAFLFTCFAFRTRACLFVGAAFRCLAGRARRQCFCAAARCAGSRLLRSVPAR